MGVRTILIASGSSSSRQAGFAFRNARHQTAKVGRGEERDDDDAKAKHDSTARKRSISGSGDDAALRLGLCSRVELCEGLYSSLVALGSGALEQVSGFAEVDFRAFSVPVTHAKASLCQG